MRCKNNSISRNKRSLIKNNVLGNKGYSILYNFQRLEDDSDIVGSNWAKEGEEFEISDD